MGRRKNSSDSQFLLRNHNSGKPHQKSNLQRKSSQRSNSNSGSNDTSGCTVIKKVASIDIQPAVLESKTEKPTEILITNCYRPLFN